MSLKDPFHECRAPSSIDGSEEPYLLWTPSRTPKALVVGLHQWGADRFTLQERMLPYCQTRQWALLLPEFRGPNMNTNPRAQEAGGGPLARRDIIDAVLHATAYRFAHPVPSFLLGGSGGAHMALMAAAREAFRWKAVSSWCPITDLAVWHQESANFAPHIEAVCGGAPGISEAVDREYGCRSPMAFSRELANMRLQLAHGRYDRVVSYRHSWSLAAAIEQHAPEEFFFSLFEGGHDLHYDEAFAFFDRTP